MNLTAFLSARSKRAQLAGGVLLFALVGTGNYLTKTPLLELSVFYLFPVSFFVWFFSLRSGIVTCVASAAVSLAVNLVRDRPSQIAYWNALIWLGFFVAISLILSELKNMYRRERKFSRVDDLTRIANRRAFYEGLSAEQSRAQRYSAPLTLAYIDLDHFKEVNDRFGHAAGDRVLFRVAQTMCRNLRRADRVGRIGGDEFAVLLPETGREAAEKVLQKLRVALDGEMRRNRWPITFSIGAVTFTGSPPAVQEMMKKADEVMYSAKNSGRNRIHQEEHAA